MNTLHHSLDQLNGTTAVERRVTEISLLMRKVFPKCAWDISEDGRSSGVSRLSIQVGEATTDIAFTNPELLAYSLLERRVDIDFRVHQALSEILH